MAAPTCPHCSIGLQEGFLLEHTRNSRAVVKWVEGKPQHSFWVGLQLRGRPVAQVSAHRCPRCGFVALYAQTTES